jgi:hypothetical protein
MVQAYRRREKRFRGVVIVMVAAVLADVPPSLERPAGTEAAFSEPAPELTFPRLVSIRYNLHGQDSLITSLAMRS